ncbi:Dihydroxyacetone kinase 1 [Pseudocercospora fuligena]|uniref:Dihydroxyacetone kinase 1 n=1 Tax=Pseudocercospora fuligena TaxID=685502 RepID=A0A8H6VHT9_9PEZI|nr:Dihydroxyacetone kinase 1 [Pseudocercospora fuligena]
MSTKHFFHHTEGVVVQGLDSLVARNNHLALDVPHKVVYSKTHHPSKVTVISGGGSGHEPAWSGYVGDGLLAAAVNGEVFASPSTKQIMAAIKHVPSDAGVILCITNYTGDNLHFGLAREKAAGMGYKVGVLRMTDDVALGRKQTENTGRRGLAANMFVLKLCGAAAESGYSFDKCMEIGYAVNANAVTVGSSLDHCHIPGREHHRSIPEDAYVLGMGIHNEPGLHEIAPMPKVEDLVSDMLKYCLDPNDKDRAFVEFKPDDVVCLLINNFGGMSNFELEALTSVTRKVLEKEWKITPKRIYAQCFETSLNAPGWSISLLNVSGIERDTKATVNGLLHLLDLDTTAPAWPRNGYRYIVPVKETAKIADANASEQKAQKGPSVDGTSLDKALRNACDAAIKAEPDITKWDIQMGDGDCGEAVVGMCQNVLKALDSGNESGFALDTKTAGQAAGAALKNLQNYTSAREGGRTVMDTLIPFCQSLEKDGDLGKAVNAAETGAKSTSGMKAKFGRASYVGENAEAQQDTPPDPGAMAAAIFLRGLLEGLAK